jgi:hypothetical protein
MRTTKTALGLLFIAACVPVSPPVPVQGDAFNLEGQWAGAYSSVTTGRSGSIVFTLAAGADTARGDVLMMPVESPSLEGSAVPDPNHIPASPQLLRIKLVRVFGHQVAGQLAPYQDPECHCTVTTIFNGRLEGDVIDGKFLMYPETSDAAIEGFWRVTRQR